MNDVSEAMRDALEAAIAAMTDENVGAQDPYPDWYGQVDEAVAKCRAALAALSAPHAPEGWRTMDSAPKDEEVFLWLDWADDCAPLNPPLDPKDMRRLYRWRPGQSWPSVYKATHWHPLPATPLPEPEK